MRSVVKFAIGAMALGLMSCAAAPKPPQKPATKPLAPVSSHFEATGKVTMHAGRPCTPQIMFDFVAAHTKSPVYLAAPVNESKVLTDAARHHRTVQISGAWQHGKETTCRYVNITKVTVQKSFFSW